MSDLQTPGTPARTAGGRALTTKRIKRRVEKLATAETGSPKKKRDKLAHTILRQIADGRIKDPAAAAKAYLAALAEGTAEPLTAPGADSPA